MYMIVFVLHDLLISILPKFCQIAEFWSIETVLYAFVDQYYNIPI